jgi:hypothetical protein
MMKRFKNEKIAMFLVIAGVAVALLCIVMVAVNGVRGTGSGTQVEVEDCDQEDFRNREKECGFVQTKAPVVVKTTKSVAPKQPAPRITRR